MPEIHENFDELRDDPTNEFTNLTNKIIKKMEKEKVKNEWHTMWEELFYITNFANLIFYFYKTRIISNGSERSVIFDIFNVNEANKEFAKNTITNFPKIHRAIFLTTFLFHSEYALKIIHDNLNLDTKKKRIIEISKNIIKKLELPDKQKKIEAIKGPVFLRNCQHSRGIFKDNTETLHIGNKIYKFEQDKPPNFVSWKTTFIFLDEFVDVMDEIIDAYKIKS